MSDDQINIAICKSKYSLFNCPVIQMAERQREKKNHFSQNKVSQLLSSFKLQTYFDFLISIYLFQPFYFIKSQTYLKNGFSCFNSFWNNKWLYHNMYLKYISYIICMSIKNCKRYIVNSQIYNLVLATFHIVLELFVCFILMCILS